MDHANLLWSWNITWAQGQCFFNCPLLKGDSTAASHCRNDIQLVIFRDLYNLSYHKKMIHLMLEDFLNWNNEYLDNWCQYAWMLYMLFEYNQWMNDKNNNAVECFVISWMVESSIWWLNGFKNTNSIIQPFWNSFVVIKFEFLIGHFKEGNSHLNFVG